MKLCVHISNYSKSYGVDDMITFVSGRMIVYTPDQISWCDWLNHKKVIDRILL